MKVFGGYIIMTQRRPSDVEEAEMSDKWLKFWAWFTVWVMHRDGCVCAGCAGMSVSKDKFVRDMLKAQEAHWVRGERSGRN